MIPKARRRTAAGAVGLALIVAAIVSAVWMEGPRARLPKRPPGERPQLMVLTSLPILFPEKVTLGAKPMPVLTALSARYTLVPISIADGSSLGGHRLLLMAQPQAQPAEVLVQLDSWVRSGGRVLLLADPALEWPSSRPLGSVLRPPLAFPDTGLLGHWGLRLDAPDSLGPESIRAGDSDIETASPGSLVATEGDCTVESGFVARCTVGKGKATVIADADFISAAEPRSANLGLLLRELDRLER